MGTVGAFEPDRAPNRKRGPRCFEFYAPYCQPYSEKYPQKFVYGGSFGSYWALEILKRKEATDVITAMVLDGVSHHKVDEREAARRHDFALDIQNKYEYCDRDPVCSTRFPSGVSFALSAILINRRL